MKNLALLTIMCLAIVGGYAQNRIHSWNTDIISSITVELTSPKGEKTVHVFNEKKDVNTLITFLKEVDFREIDGRTLKVKEPASKEYAKILFQGQRDQIYLFHKIAHIGKTTFVIDQDVLSGFMSKMKELEE